MVAWPMGGCHSSALLPLSTTFEGTCSLQGRAVSILKSPHRAHVHEGWDSLRAPCREAWEEYGELSSGLH